MSAPGDLHELADHLGPEDAAVLVAQLDGLRVLGVCRAGLESNSPGGVGDGGDKCFLILCRHPQARESREGWGCVCRETLTFTPQFSESVTSATGDIYPLFDKLLPLAAGNPEIL